MEKTALIVAHGQPSDPGQAEADLARLADGVALHLPGWRVGSATLAAPGAVEAAVARLGAPVVFPFFMADGWFTQQELPRRLGNPALTILPPFGRMAAAATLAGQAARTAVIGRGWTVDDAVVVLAAHGSGRSRAPAEAARAVQTALAGLGFSEVRLGFIEEAPSLQEVAAGAGERAVCLPLFVARWGHVVTDIPAALAAAGFRGPCLAPLGTRPEVAGIIAGALNDKLGEMPPPPTRA